MSIWGELLLTYVLNVFWLGIVNAGLAWLAARCYWPGAYPIGKRLAMGSV